MARSPQREPESDDDALDNLGQDDSPDAKVGGIAVERLRSLIERVERLEEERKSLASDIKDIYAEAKSADPEPSPSGILSVRSGGLKASTPYHPAS